MDSSPGPSSAPAQSAAPAAPKRRRFGWLVEIALFVALFLGIQAFQSRGAISGDAPPLQGTLAQGGTRSLAELRGRPVLVHFWGSWCGVCRMEEGSIDALARDWPVLSVAVGSGEAARVASYLRSQKLDIPSLVDPEGSRAEAWGVRSFPTSFVVDGAGRIRFVTVGYTTGLGLRARLWWASRTSG